MLYIIPTPIGNLEDITIRAIKILKKSNYIIIENYYRTQILFKKYKILNKKLLLNNKFNEHKKKNFIFNKIINNKICSLISNAGTPLISDPGYLIIKKCIKNNIKINVLPGANAFIPALISSGFPIHNFVFIGFLPLKKKKISEIFNIKKTLIIYDTSKKIKKNFIKNKNFLLNKKIFIHKEISKIYEEKIYFKYTKKNKLLFLNKIKGELTIIVDNNN
ncbi:MAG: 16S rRNA (cytidine(1402)-2'-O)-methyltransferase [Candidatus Shikimatogenerans sp. Tser]|uniref:16S rRNA (Cytidine(1402)-2'-O)-methyltransferase n=1 Tax=Candidatus Shikimatogenerans sp. Tser TaxID=3158568 RepID=A0AAU7QQH7_9FLAO